MHHQAYWFSEGPYNFMLDVLGLPLETNPLLSFKATAEALSEAMNERHSWYIDLRGID